jgi:hypothetical protein
MVRASRTTETGSRWLVQALLAAVCAVDGARSASAQFTPPVVSFTRSRSGQFLVHDTTRSSVAPRNIATNAAYVRLDPTLLAVSTERFKDNLRRELGLTAPWIGKIHLYLFPAQTGFEPVTVTSEHFKDGWEYRVDLPGWIQRERFARGMTQVLLTEIANRNGGERSAEIPTWLLEGLTRQLLISCGPEIIIPAPGLIGANIPLGSTNLNMLREHPLQRAHDLLEQKNPLTFEQLSWPAENQFSGPAAELYISSAQLFVERLLQLNDGRACLRNMLADLPRRLNWQFAFLSAFHRYFQRPLDTEKWWALQTLNFTGRALAQTWSEEESWARLDTAIHSSVQVRTGTNDLPLHTAVSLQKLIRESDLSRQNQLLKEKIHELDLLRIRLAQRFVPVVDDYRNALARYLQIQEKENLALFQKKAAHKRAADQILKELDALDDRRLAMQPPGDVMANLRGQSAHR